MSGGEERLRAAGIALGFDPEGGLVTGFTVTDEGQEVTPLHRAPWVDSGEALPEGNRDRELLTAALLSELARVRPQEIERGVSLVGPHRDDVLLGLSGLPVKGYASHGESWSYALALRLASYELLRADGGEPVLVLDDVFAELDTGRRDRLAELVAGAEQVLVTAAVPADVPEALAGSRYDVHEGTVTRVR